MIYGYARVSTATQGRDGNSLEEQSAALVSYGAEGSKDFLGFVLIHSLFLHIFIPKPSKILHP